MTRILGWLLGYDNASQIESLEWSLAAPWASGRGGWLLVACLAATGLAILYYRRFETPSNSRWLPWCAACRAAVLVLLLLTLAAPLVTSSATVSHAPLVCVVADDTASMGVADGVAEQGAPATRTAQLQRLFSADGGDFLQRLQRSANCRVKTFILTGDDATELRPVAPTQLPHSLTHRGQVTDFDQALQQLARQHDAARAAAIVLFSDFVHSAPSPPPDPRHATAELDLAPLYTVGVGAEELTNVEVGLITEPWARVGQPTSVRVEIRQQHLNGATAAVAVHHRSLRREVATGAAPEQLLERRSVTLEKDEITLEFDLTPAAAGLVEVAAAVEPVSGEIVSEDNTARRQIIVLEDPLRLLYVTDEPSWEWRFMKEVFHRDELVGPAGFQTYLASADPRVVAAGEIYLPALPTDRADVLSRDVIILEGVPESALRPDFVTLVEEFVGQFGGGLVVLAGPGFNSARVDATPLAQMLPVILDSESQRRDGEFRVRLTPEAALMPFMQLGATPLEQEQAWHNLGPLAWYQPVAAVHEQARVLAAHPTEHCADRQTPQPLVALRPYGRGQVAYLGFNELWRLRRRYGDQYYQRFWSQLTYHLGMGPALGRDRRFVVRLPKEQFQLNEQAVCSVICFDADFLPLSSAAAPRVELIAVTDSGTKTVELPLVGEGGEYEAALPLTQAGDYLLHVTDPVTGRVHQRRFQVQSGSLERQRVVRDGALQRRLAAATGGAAYDLADVDQLLQELKLMPVIERETRYLALWNTPLWFLAVVVLMLGEWGLRKYLYLR